MTRAPDTGIEISVPHQLLWEARTVLATYIACASSDDEPPCRPSHPTEEKAREVLEALTSFVFEE